MQEEIDPSSGEDSPFHVLLADLGEAAAVDIMFSQEFKNSRISKAEMKNYVPPEVRGQGYVTASDIFAWGQLAIDVIRQSHSALVWEDGQIRFPKRLMATLESCLATDPKERPTAASLTAIVRELTYEIWGRPEESIEWILGSYELPKVAKELSTSLQMSSEWYRSD